MDHFPSISYSKTPTRLSKYGSSLELEIWSLQIYLITETNLKVWEM